MKNYIRYSLCVLVSAIAWAFSFHYILGLVWMISYKFDQRWWVSGYHEFNEGLLPAFLCAAVAVSAWHFRNPIKKHPLPADTGRGQ
jgi:hypothetical protein